MMRFIKAKAALASHTRALSENRFLHENQLISDDHYREEKNNYYTAWLDNLQARTALADALHNVDIADKEINHLTIEDTQKFLRFYAPIDMHYI